MDKRLQRYLTVIFLFIVTLGYSQCDKNELRIVTDTVECTKIIMSKEKFGYYYSVEKNLKAIEDSIPVLAKGIEDERERRDSIEVKLANQVQVSTNRAQLLSQSLDDCVETATFLEVRNLKLQKKLIKAKKSKWIYGGGGTLLGLLLRLIL